MFTTNTHPQTITNLRGSNFTEHH